MADTDEEDIVGDVETPVDRLIHTGDHHAVLQLKQPLIGAVGDDCNEEAYGDPDTSAGLKNRAQKRFLNRSIPA
jgi:hypothetical protein